MSNEVIIIGVDPSLSHTAIHGPFGARGIETSPKNYAHPIARLVHIGEEFDRVIELALRHAAGNSAGFAYVEGYGFGTQMAHALGELGGMLRMQLYERGWTIVLVPPSTLKKFVTGSGAAEKDRMMVEILDRWKYKATDNNDADAYALLRFGIEHQRHMHGEHVTKVSAECFAKVETWYPAHLAHLQATKAPKQRKKKAA